MPDWRERVRAAIAHLNLEPGREESIVEELAGHMSEQYHELLANGVPEDEAYRRLTEELQGQTLRTGLRPVFSPERAPVSPGSIEPRALFPGIGKDLWLAMRMLRLNAGFALVAILSLAFGIGANTAIFQLIDAVVLRTLPVPQPRTLADVRVIHEGRIGNTVARQQEMSSAMWEELKRRQQAFSSIAAWSSDSFNLGHGGEARYAQGLWVSGSFFETLRVRPARGRLFSEGDDHKACGDEGVVISYSFWQGEFGGRENVLGKPVSLNGRAFPIIGITPAPFSGLEVGRKFDVALPLCSESLMHPEERWTESNITWWLAVIGRLKPGWTFGRASAQLAALSPDVFTATLPAQYDAIARANYLRFRFRAAPAATGDSPLRKMYEDSLWLLLAISAVVLLIACANIANLMLARASARQQEMAVRLAMGASRGRLIRQLLVESLLLATAGTAIGTGMAVLLSRALIAGISSGQDRVFLPLSTDWRVLAFTAALAILTCVVFGVAPALHAANTEPGMVMKTGGRSLTAGREGLLLRRGFIVSQVAFSLVLLVAALLFVRTFQNLTNVKPGFQQEHVLAADFDFSALKLPVPSRLEYKRELLDRVRTIPGVTAAAAAFIVPLSGEGWNEFIDIPGTNVQRKTVNFNRVSSGFFRTLDVVFLAGRDFNDADTVNSPPVAVVNQAFAAALLGGGNPVGKKFGVRQDGGRPETIYQIVGLAADTKYGRIEEPYGPIAFVAQSQNAQPDPDSTILIRSNQAMTSLISALKTAAAAQDPAIVLNFTVLQTAMRERLGRERLMAALSGFYGLLAVMLSTVGLYGMVSYTVVLRKNEIGIRMALGATRPRILGMILSDALRMLAAGFAFGIVLVIAAGRAVQSMLFDVKPTDPLSLAIAIAGLAAVAIVSSLLPARRAASVEPIETLRAE